MQQLGIEVHLGHHGQHCPHPENPIKDFTVVDVSGIHTITLRFCACPGAPHARYQLLQSSWFPSSLDRPHTAFTFDVLDTFQLLNLQGKLSAYDFYYSLDPTRLTTLEYSAYRYHILYPVLISSLTLSRTGTTNFLLQSTYFDTSRCLKGPGVATIPLVSMQHNQVTVLSNVPLARTRNVIFLKGGKMRLNMSSKFHGTDVTPLLMLF